MKVYAVFTSVDYGDCFLEELFESKSLAEEFVNKYWADNSTKYLIEEWEVKNEVMPKLPKE